MNRHYFSVTWELPVWKPAPETDNVVSWKKKLKKKTNKKKQQKKNKQNEPTHPTPHKKNKICL